MLWGSRVDFNAAALEAAYRPVVAQYAAFYFGLPPPTPVFMAQIKQESNFRRDAKSPVGALGLMQQMPATAKWIGAEIALPATPLDPEWSIRAGVWYDKFLFDRVPYKNVCDKWGAALSSYNGGLGWHNKRRGRAEDPQDFWNSVRWINPGITAANQGENQEYPYRIVYKHQPAFFRIGDRKVCFN